MLSFLSRYVSSPYVRIHCTQTAACATTLFPGITLALPRPIHICAPSCNNERSTHPDVTCNQDLEGLSIPAPSPYPDVLVPQLHLKQVRLDHIKSNEAAARIQAMERGRVARRDAAAERAARTAAAAKAEAETRAQAELEESARRLAAANEERNAARAAVKIQCAARQRRAREQAALRLRGRREEEEKRALAVMKIQAAERGRVTRRELALRREDARRAAAVKIQSVVRGWLVRKVAEEEAEAAALDAAIAARRARVAAEAEAGATGEGVQGRAGWRKKSVVGARGAEGLAGLQVQVPTSGNPRRDEGMPRSSLYGGVAYS